MQKLTFFFVLMGLCSHLPKLYSRELASGLIVEDNHPLHSKRKNPLLLCLGREEERIHDQRTLGAVYRLNQSLINRMILANNVGVKKSYLNQICNNKLYSPSVTFLRLIIFKGMDLFTFDNNQDASSATPYQKNMVEEMLDEAPNDFMQFITDLQGMMPRAHCLEEHIPEIGQLFERYKYLEGEVPQSKLFKSQLVSGIFDRLNGLDRIYKRCQKEAEIAKSKRRLKRISNTESLSSNAEEAPTKKRRRVIRRGGGRILSKEQLRKERLKRRRRMRKFKSKGQPNSTAK